MQYNLSLFYKDFFAFGIYIYNKEIYDYFLQYIPEYKKDNIYFYFFHSYNNQLYYNKMEDIYLCANEFLYFLNSNQTLYRVDIKFNFFKLKIKSKYTYTLLYEVCNLNDCLNYFYVNNFIKNPFFYNIILNKTLLLKLKTLVFDKLLSLNYIFFNYNGFEFQDVIFDNRSFSIIKKENVPSFFTCFLFFDKLFDLFIKEFNPNVLKINKFFYYNNLSFDFFFYLGLLLNKLTGFEEKPLLQVSLFFYGSSQTNKTTLLTALFEVLFGSQKDASFNLGTTKDLTSFKSQMIDKNIL